MDYTQDPNCQGAWRMNVDEDPLADASGNGRTAALQSAGHPDFASAAPPKAYAAGYYSFDGVQDYALAAEDPAFRWGVGDFSIVGWIKKVGAAYYYTLAAKGQTAAGEWLIYFVDANSIRFYSGSGIDSGYIAGAADGDWHHIACVREGDNFDFYVDGVSKATIPGVDNVDLHNATHHLTIGAAEDGTARRHDGDICEVAVFNRALSSVEINDIIDNGLAGPAANPYPTGRLRKDVISGYHCFMNAYIGAKISGYDPLKLPDGTIF